MAKALWHLSDQKSALKKVEPPENPKDYYCIKSCYSLVSTGTERLVAKGEIPETLHDSMQVPNMEGNFRFPLKYGYSLIGEIINEDHPRKGQMVHLMHPHQDYCWVREEQLFFIDESVPAKRACLASNMETVLNAVWDSNISLGDKAFVCGFGIIGSLLARLLNSIPGVEVVIAELNPMRRKQAEAMGFIVKDEIKPDYFDLAFNTSVNERGLQNCIDAVGLEGRVVELSWYGTQPVTLQLGAGFHQKRKMIISSQVSHIPANRTNRWTYRRRKEAVFELLKDEAFDQHLTHCIPFEQTPAFFNQLRRESPEGLGYFIEY